MEELIANSNFKYILLSYNSEGIINEENLEKLLKKYSKNLYKKYKFEYRRYKKDTKSNMNKLYEIIYIIDKKIVMNFKDLKKINNFFDQKLSNDNLEELGNQY